MGQYYKIVLLDTEGDFHVLYPFDYDNGMKLMEFSWQGNEYCNALVTLLNCNPRGKVAVVGDYSDSRDSIKKSNALRKRFFSRAWGKMNKSIYDTPVPYIGDPLYICNEKREECFLYNPLRPTDGELHENPLTLLLADGNGLGGGDFHGGEGFDIIGKWSYEPLFCSSTRPFGYVEIAPVFKED